MQVIKKERINVYEVYAAMDGTEFNTVEECRKYENSAKCVLLSKYTVPCSNIAPCLLLASISANFFAESSVILSSDL